MLLLQVMACAVLAGCRYERSCQAGEAAGTRRLFRSDFFWIIGMMKGLADEIKYFIFPVESAAVDWCFDVRF